MAPSSGNYLIDPFPVANLSRRDRMDMEAQVSDHRLAHLLLVCDGGYRKFTRLLLNQREGRDFRFLRMRLSVDVVPVSRC
jgi:hypothetical protein